MAEIDINYSGGVIMDGPDAAPHGSMDIDVGALVIETIQVANSSTFSLADSSGRITTFTGSGLTYSSLDAPTGGTFTGATVTADGVVELKVSGFQIAAADLVSWAASDDNTSMLQAILGGANTIHGGPGADQLRGWGASDLINGGPGDDTLIGGTGLETLLGGQGNDLIDASASTGANVLNGNLGNDTLVGGAGADTLRGGQGDDVIHAGAGNDWISGDLGNNTIYGGQGMDTLHAGAGHDVVSGWHSGDVVHLAAGVTYTVTQVTADVHINFSNGGEMDLLNTQASSLSGGWLIQS